VDNRGIINGPLTEMAKATSTVEPKESGSETLDDQWMGESTTTEPDDEDREE
jgi:hypothetical protein